MLASINIFRYAISFWHSPWYLAFQTMWNVGLTIRQIIQYNKKKTEKQKNMNTSQTPSALFNQQLEDNSAAGAVQLPGAQPSAVETEIDELLGVAATVAAPYIKSTPANAALAVSLGVAPTVVHSLMMLVSLFQHPKVQAAVAAVAAAPVAAPAPDPVAIAAAAKAARIAAAQAALDAANNS